MHIIIRLSMTLKLKIRRSVLRTVLKLRFSRVRKYFWFRVIVDSWPDSLKIDSSSADVCSGDDPCFEGIDARASFSTCARGGGSVSQFCIIPRVEGEGGWRCNRHCHYSTTLGRAQLQGRKRTEISKSTNFSANVLI
jgi:hypothetical protein